MTSSSVSLRLIAFWEQLSLWTVQLCTMLSPALLTAYVWEDCRLGEYSLHDLVVLDQQTVGVIISIGSDSCQVLTNKNQVRENLFWTGHLSALLAI